MMFKIIALITIAKVSVGDAHMNYHEPHNSMKHAISSQSFIRHDVPLSYKHSAVHIYSTEKPQHYGHKPVTPPFKLTDSNFRPQEIQYAPIIREQKIGYDHNAAVLQNTTKNIELPRKNYLEPKPLSHPEQLPFVPGYNIEVLQSVNRYPGHNAVYRSYPNMKPYEKLNKQHHLKQLILHDRKQENLVPELSETTPSAPTFDFVPKQYKTEISNSYGTGPYITDLSSLVTPQLAALNLQLEGYPPHPKAHRMLLNIARTYNIAKLPSKAQKDIVRHTLQNSPIKTQPTLKLTNVNTQKNEKTRLFPVKYKSLPQYS